MKLNRWLHLHIEIVALVITGIGFILRVILAYPSWLNPDEAIHAVMSNQPNLLAVYQANLREPHPPLLHIILYLWRFIGTSDFMLRLPSVLAGTAALWFFFKWLSKSLDRSTALIGLIVLTFAPSVVYFSAEIREYSFLLLFITAALYFLELAFKERTARYIILFTVMLWLALLMHYSATMFLFIMGLYSLYRVIRERVSARIFVSWLAGQVATASLFLFLYFTHITKIRGNGLEASVKQGFLQSFYFNPKLENVLSFLLTRTVDAFKFLFSSPALGTIALFLFFAGLIILILRGIRKHEPSNWELGLLLLAPLLVAGFSSIVGFYPYGGTRHISFLVPFVIAGVGYFLANLTGPRILPILLAGAVLMPAWEITRGNMGAGWYINPANMRRTLLAQAIEYIRTLTPKDGIIFSDIETHNIIRHYLYQGEPLTKAAAPFGFYQFSYDNYRIVSLKYWRMEAEDFGDEFYRMAESYGLGSGEPVCVVYAGWGKSLALRLQEINRAYPKLRFFGHNISVFVVPVGMEIHSDSLDSKIKRISNLLDSLANLAVENLTVRPRTVFWPTYYLNEKVEERFGNLNLQVIPYAELYKIMPNGERRFEDFLPALGLWIFDSREQHIPIFSFMSEKENYIASGYAFTLSYIDPAGMVALYHIDRTRGDERIILPIGE